MAKIGLYNSSAKVPAVLSSLAQLLDTSVTGQPGFHFYDQKNEPLLWKPEKYSLCLITVGILIKFSGTYLMLALGMWKQEEQGFRVSLNSIVRISQPGIHMKEGGKKKKKKHRAS